MLFVSTFLGGYQDGTIGATGTVNGGVFEYFDTIDIIDINEVEAFDYHAVNDKERCLIAINAIGATDVESSIPTWNTGRSDNETRDASLQCHSDIGIARFGKFFARDTIAYLYTLTLFDETITPVDEFLVFLCL